MSHKWLICFSTELFCTKKEKPLVFTSGLIFYIRLAFANDANHVAIGEASCVSFVHINMHFQLEFVAYTAKNFLEYHFAFAANLNVNTIFVFKTKTFCVRGMHMDMFYCDDAAFGHIHGAFGANDGDGSRICEIAGISQRSFDAEFEAIGNGNFNLSLFITFWIQIMKKLFTK